MAAVVAAVRARETERGKGAFVRDAGARRFVDADAEQALDHNWRAVPYFQPLILVRTRLFRNEVARLLREEPSIRQVVSVGAGYSTFLDALQRRRPRLRTFECDRADLIKRKRAVVGPSYRPRLVAVNLTRDAMRLPSLLTEAGLDGSRRSLILMEGLLYYISGARTTDHLFRSISALCGRCGGVAVFDVYTNQSPQVGSSVKKALKTSGLTAKMVDLSAWCQRLERLGMTVRKAGNIAWLDSWGKLARYRSRVSSCMFTVEIPSANLAR
jgi:methyltransferase (TIGR00027 family)